FLCACFTRLSGRFPSILRFRLYQILAVLIFAGAFPPFGFFAFPTLSDPASFDSGSDFRRRVASEQLFTAALSAWSLL
ncbi:hypothetical protein AB0G60_33375, partial [Streptomyces angustmyceticus]